VAYAGIGEQARLVAAGELSSRELVELCLARIERYDGRLNAFRVVFAERARLEADQADGRRKAGASPTERPLLGVPIAVKDDIDVGGEVTTFGTNAYGAPAREDAEIVRRLRAAGAVVIGKTNVPELCAFPWTESPTFGVTRNPWNLDRSPGGSSGGTAAAVAAGLVGAGLGSDGGGSIRFPAAYCGLFGLKTQRGRVPLAPHVDAWRGLSVNGVLTRTVRDSALFYDAIADGPPDPVYPPIRAPAVARSSFLGALGQVAGGGGQGASNGSPSARALKIAVASELPPSPLTRLAPENEAALSETVALLQSLGHEVERREIDFGPLAPAPEFTARYLRSLYEEAGTLAYPARLERRMRTLARLGRLLAAPTVVEWVRSREQELTRRMNAPLVDHDVLLMPVTPAPAPAIGACEGRSWLWTTATAAATVPYAACWNATGQPACAVPAGLAGDGLPRSVQLVGKPNDEVTLIALAAQIEAQRPWEQERPPGFE
jgi:amidase